MSQKITTRRNLVIAKKEKEPEKEAIAASAGSESSQLIGMQNKADNSK